MKNLVLLMCAMTGMVLTSCSKKDAAISGNYVYTLEFAVDDEDPGTVYHIEQNQNGQFIEVKSLGYDPALHGNYSVELPCEKGTQVRVRSTDAENHVIISPVILVQ